jgi:hypothetical protein
MSDINKTGVFLLILILILIGVAFASATIGYNEKLPNNAIWFTASEVEGRVYTNDYKIEDGYLIVYSYYRKNLFGKYDYIDLPVISSNFTIEPFVKFQELEPK